jgi:hypothetical protein
VDDGGRPTSHLLYANGVLLAALAPGQLSHVVSPFKTTDTRSFTVAGKDETGNIGAKTYALRGIPSVKGLTVSRAKRVLAARKLRAGKVRKEFSSTVRKDLVIRSTLTGVAREGTAVPLVISKGRNEGASVPRLVLDVTNATAVAEATRDILTVNIFLSRAASTTVQILNRDGERLLTWDRDLSAGSTAVEMRVPVGVLAAQTYTVLVTAVAPNGARVSDRVQITVPSRQEDPPPATPSDSTPSTPSEPSLNEPSDGGGRVESTAGEPVGQPEVTAAAPEAETKPQTKAAGPRQAAPGRPSAEAEPARESLGLVIFIVAIATGLLTAILKGGALAGALRRRPPR